MALILGMPMVGHVYLRSKMCDALDEVYVATCDQEIADYIKAIGGKAIMTADTHERASDRTAEALLKAEAQLGRRVDIVVLIQGDEPMVTPEMIKSAVKPLAEDNTILVSNLMSTMDSVEGFEDPNEVKVVVDCQGFALYFSREPIPSRRKGTSKVQMLKQICIIPFQRDFLLQYNEMKQTPLEIVESVDMNRILENGLKVKMVMTEIETFAVDVPADLKEVEKHLLRDRLLPLYLKGHTVS